jgi:hypothetical protein
LSWRLAAVFRIPRGGAAPAPARLPRDGCREGEAPAAAAEEEDEEEDRGSDEDEGARDDSDRGGGRRAGLSVMAPLSAGFGFSIVCFQLAPRRKIKIASMR